MAMQINGNYDHFQTNYAEMAKETQNARNTERDRETETKGAAKLSEPQDEYVSSRKSEKESTGLYRLEQNEDGSREIIFDDLNKPAQTDEKEETKESSNNPEKAGEKCVGNTDKVDREIKKLKGKVKELEQQIQSASGDEEKVKELEKKLTQVKQELSLKDNDTYRRKNTVFLK